MRYFTVDEFACKCGCGKNYLTALGVGEFHEKLDLARHDAGIPFIITSGYRCEVHNRNVGGRDNSAHRKGLAVDISCTTSRQRFIILQALIGVGFTRIGIAKTFIHVDSDETKAAKVCWLY